MTRVLQQPHGTEFAFFLNWMWTKEVMMGPKEIKRIIESELAAVNRDVAALKKEPRAEELEGFGDNTPLSEEIDAIAAGENEELRASHLARLLDRAAALDEALHRLGEGTYGICLSCGGKIRPERLRVEPEAAYCLRCQQELESGPAHEEIRQNEWRLTEDVDEARKEFEEGGTVTPAKELDEAARDYAKD
jgi:DnaK suppressor protein